jgi:hypothetical protein
VILIKGKLYDALKFLALVAIPAFGTLYFALGAIWSLPAVDEVTKTVIAVDTFLGALLHLSSTAYSKGVETAGEMHVEHDGKLSFVVDGDKTDVDQLGNKQEVRFTVKKKPKAVPEIEPPGGEHP